MPFTSAAGSELARYSKQISYRLELRTHDPASSDWLEYRFEDFSLTTEARSPTLLRAELINSGLDFSDEASPACRTQLLAQVRLSCTVGAESEVLFDGRIFRIEPRDYSFTIYAQDWLGLVNDCECEVDLKPDETELIEPARQVFLTGGGAFGNVYGLAYTGPGDPAFNADSDPGSRRRSFAAGDIRLWYDGAATLEVAPQHYQINLTSGTFTILEDSSGRDYFASGLRCYIEGTLDWAAVFEAAHSYPATDGGMDIPAAQLDLPDTGIDLAGPIYFRGRVGDLLLQIGRRQQENLRLWYDSRSQKFRLRLITQKAAGQEDFELMHPRSIAQPRDVRDLYSRVVVTGLAERPRNALTLPETTASDLTAAGDWFAWDGLNVGTDEDFADVIGLLYDGDSNKGASVHNLPASEGSGSGRYDSWYGYAKFDLGSLQRLTRVRVTMPGSRNMNAQAGHQGLFWPGLQLLASEDDSDYRLLSAILFGRFPPHARLEAEGKDILQPRLRYVKILLGAYKHGMDNHDDPSIGLAELELYTSEEYRVVKEIDGAAAPPSHYEFSADYDRDGAVDLWQRNHAALWKRLGERHRTLCEDQSGNLNELLAHDRAIDLLAESVRLFQQVSYEAVSDPRISLYDTVKVEDSFNGSSGSILVERIVLAPAATWISGTDYLAEASATERSATSTCPNKE